MGKAFIAKLSGANGNYIWGHAYSTDFSTQTPVGLAFDGQGNLAVAGYFDGTVDFGNGSGVLSALGSDGFVVKLSASSGTTMWSKRMGGTGTDFIHGVACDSASDVIVTGETPGGDFNGTPLTTLGSNDAFLVKIGGQ